MEAKIQKQRYSKIDGLRAAAAIGIVLMHVQANLDYRPDGFIFEKLIPSFTDLVFLFMMISSFSLCCGYYDRIVAGQISLEKFYKKRFAKVWPFFAALCLLDFALSPSVESLFEVLANLTLCFGLIPNHGIEVIGVGWFLGLVFVFYFLFPFFCYLLSDRKRAWFSTLVALLLNFLCECYFDAGRTSIAYSGVFFLLGGIIYLYRESLQRFAEKHGIIVVGFTIGAAGLYYSSGAKVPAMLLLYGFILIFALRSGSQRINLLDNAATKWLSGISMEIYLSHMVIFRALEIAIMSRMQGLSDGLRYVIMAVATLLGTVVFSYVAQKMLARFCEWIKLWKHTIGDVSNG